MGDSLKSQKGIITLACAPSEFNGKVNIGIKLQGKSDFYNCYDNIEANKKILKKGNEIEFKANGTIISDIKLVKKAEVKSSTNRNNLEIDQRFIVNIQGKEFITYNGLLAYAEKKGGIEKKEILNLRESDDWKSASATVQITMKDGRIFQDVGTCTPKNVKAVDTYPTELAVTRAYARALRTGLNVDYCSKEEIS